MFTIDEITGEITLNRGDTAQFSIFINAGTDICPVQYQLQPQDNLYMAIEEPNQLFENAIVKKLINTADCIEDKEGNIIVDITTEDTVGLLPGLYYYEIKANLYKQNQFRNGYNLVTLGTDYTFTICDESTGEEISGTYTYDPNTGSLILSCADGSTITGSISGKILSLSTGLRYKQQENAINTIIPKTKFTIQE